MNMAASFPVIVNGRSFELRPLTVRERMKLANIHAERERMKAIELAKAMDARGREAIEFVASRAEEAERMSSFVMSCFSLDGAMAVLLLAARSHAEAEEIASMVEPAELGRFAAMCLNVAVASADGGSVGSGN